MTASLPLDPRQVALFFEQVYFLERSADLFDQGFWLEAKRLALTVRLLCLDSTGGASVSLLSKMGLKNSNTWLMLGGGVNPNNVIPTESLVAMRSTMLPNSVQVSKVPLDLNYLREVGGEEVSFETWWGQIVIKDRKGLEFTRQDIVRLLCNRDGGAHIDDLSHKQESIHSGQELGWHIGFEGVETEIFVSPIIPSMRTIAFEVHEYLMSLMPLVRPWNPEETH